MQVGVYKNDKGYVEVVYPNEKFLETFSLDQIISAAVPQGISYYLVDINQIPTDKTFRDAWDIDTTLEAQGVGAKVDVPSEITGA